MDITEILTSLGAGTTVTVEPLLGHNSNGPVYGTAVELTPCFVDQKRRMIRDRTGRQTLSSTTVYATLQASVPAGSRVTLPDGSTTVALTVSDRRGYGLDVPEHTEIACQ